MIHYYNHWVFGSGEIMMPLLQCLDDSKELLIIDVVVPFHGGEGGRMIGAGVKVSIGVFLHEYSSRGGERGIGHDKEGFGGVWHFNYWGREECFFEFDECIILFLSP